MDKGYHRLKGAKRGPGFQIFATKSPICYPGGSYGLTPLTGVSWCVFFSWVVDNALDMGVGIRYVVDDIVYVYIYDYMYLDVVSGMF